MQSRNLLIIFFDKIVKLMHLALMHPKDYTVEVLSKFLNAERRKGPVPLGENHRNQRNWVYITEIFRITNELSHSCTYLYGQVEVKLAYARFISEYLIRSNSNGFLDEMVDSFDGERVRDEN